RAPTGSLPNPTSPQRQQGKDWPLLALRAGEQESSLGDPMNTHARNPEPTSSPSTLSGILSLPSSDASLPAEPGSNLTPPPQRCLGEQLTVPELDASSAKLRLPRVVGKYVLLEQVLVGGMGVVYKAHDTELDRIVALKMIKGGLLATDEEIARFRYEA